MSLAYRTAALHWPDDGRSGNLGRWRNLQSGHEVVAEIEWDADRRQIVVTGLQFESSLEILALTLSKLVNDRQIEGIRSISNESTDDESRLVIQVRNDANHQAVVDAVSTYMPSDEAEVNVDPRDWEPDVVCPRCGKVVARRDWETGNPLNVSSTLIRAIGAPPDSPEAFRSAQIWTDGVVAHECGAGSDPATP